MNWQIELIGWIGFAVLLFAYTRRDLQELRIWAIVASVVLSGYFASIKSIPGLAIQLVAILINSWRAIKKRKK